ncbi:MAG: hypothetical protein IIC50_08805 [Planctomycetes bacterium]|nr:hypothetical protein [Planctomycetota bacterium]
MSSAGSVGINVPCVKRVKGCFMGRWVLYRATVPQHCISRSARYAAAMNRFPEDIYFILDSFVVPAEIAENTPLSENSLVGPRASVFSSGKDGEAGDVGFIVDAARRKKGRSKPDRILRQAPIPIPRQRLRKTIQV